jgi:hypothetical protein
MNICQKNKKTLLVRKEGKLKAIQRRPADEDAELLID